MSTRRRLRCSLARPQGGFSLLEVLVALGVFGMVAGHLTAVFWTSRQQIERLDRGSRVAEDRLVVRRIVGAYLQSAAGLAGPDTGFGGDAEPGPPDFTGDARHLSFLATLAEPRGLFRIELTIDGDTGSSSLRLKRQRVVDAAAATGPDAAPVETALLYTGKAPLSFSYGDATADGLAWRREWAEHRMPQQVRISEGEWSLVTVAPAVSISAPCLRRRGIEGLDAGACLVR